MGWPVASLLEQIQAEEAAEKNAPSIYDQVRSQEAAELTHTESGAGVDPDTFLGARLGGPFDPTRGMEDFGLRASMSLSSPKDKFRKFAEKYPSGELKFERDDPRNKRSQTLVFRTTPDEPWRKVDKDLFDGLEMGDIADLAGDLPSLVGELAATVRTKGASLASLVMRGATGAALGEMGKQAIERGPLGSEWDVKEAFGEAAEKAATGALGIAAGDVFARAINTVRGAGATTPTSEAQAVIDEAQRFGVPDLLPGQATINPIIQAFSRQSRALSGKIREYEIGQEAGAMALLDSLRDKGILLPVTGRIADALEKTEAKITSQLIGKASGGRALKEGLETYRDMSGRAVGQQYEYARTIEQPDFDISDVIKVADDIERGVRAYSKRLDAEGNPVTVDVQGDLPGDLGAVLSDIRQLDSTLRTTEGPGGAGAFDQLKALRSRLFDLKTPDDGVFRNENRLAADLYKAITNAMDNPIGTGNPEFVKAWGVASRMAKNRFDTLEHDFIVRALKTHNAGDLEALFKGAFRPDNATQLGFMRDAIKSVPQAQRKWLRFRDAGFSEIIKNPYKIRETIEAYGDSLTQVFSRQEIGEMIKIGDTFAGIKKSGVIDALNRHDDSAALVRDLIETDSTAAITELIKVSGGPKTQIGRGIRAGIAEYVYDEVVSRTKDGTRISANMVDDIMKGLRRNKADKFLTAEDRAVLKFIPQYLRFVQAYGTDAGESIRRGQIIQDLTTAPISALRAIGEEVGIGRLMTSKGGRAFLYGTGRRERLDFNYLKRLSGAAAILASDLEAELEDTQ